MKCFTTQNTTDKMKCFIRQKDRQDEVFYHTKQ